jgi:hypothetical protein
VCSIDESALRRVAEAIDQLDASRKSADSSGLEAQVAAVWAMVSEIDPELARLASRYAGPATSRPGRTGSVPDRPR